MEKINSYAGIFSKTLGAKSEIEGQWVIEPLSVFSPQVKD